MGWMTAASPARTSPGDTRLSLPSRMRGTHHDLPARGCPGSCNRRPWAIIQTTVSVDLRPRTPDFAASSASTPSKFLDRVQDHRFSPRPAIQLLPAMSRVCSIRGSRPRMGRKIHRSGLAKKKFTSVFLWSKSLLRRHYKQSEVTVYEKYPSDCLYSKLLLWKYYKKTEGHLSAFGPIIVH